MKIFLPLRITIAYILLLIGVSAIANTSLSQAEGGSGITVSASMLDYTQDCGGYYSMPLSIANTGNELAQIQISSRSYNPYVGYKIICTLTTLNDVFTMNLETQDGEVVGELAPLLHQGINEILIAGLDYQVNYVLNIQDPGFICRFSNIFIQQIYTGQEVINQPFLVCGPQILLLGSPDYVPEGDWLGVYPEFIYLAPGEITELTIILDLQNIIAGYYNGQILFNVNTGQELISLPVSLEALGEAEFSFDPPSLLFDQVFSGAGVSQTTTLTNTGFDTLTVSLITISGDLVFGFSPMLFHLAPFESRELNFDFFAPEPGIYNAAISFTTPEGITNFLLTGISIPAPEISVTDVVEIELLPGTQETYVLEIANTGGNNLTQAVILDTLGGICGIKFHFVTGIDGEGFFWNLTAQNFTFIAQSSTPFINLQDYSETITNLNPAMSYTFQFQYTGLLFPTQVLSLFEVIDIATGDVIATGSMDNISFKTVSFNSLVQIPATDWISFNTDFMITEPGAISSIPITFMAMPNEPEGLHTNALEILSNDPLNPVLKVPVRMHIIGSVSAAASANKSAVCRGEPIVFTDLSAGEITSWHWNFGDGNYSEDANPSYAYQQGGPYHPTLTVCNELGCSTMEGNIEIIVEESCEFVAMQQTPQMIYSCFGTITDSGGSENPYAEMENSIITIAPAEGGTVELLFISFALEPIFDNLIIYDGADINAPQLGMWSGTDILPGTVISSSGNVLTLQFITDATLSLSGFQINYSCADFMQAPHPGFGYEVLNDCNGTVLFNDESTFFPETWQWTFPAGESNEINPQYIFNSAGSFPVTLTVCNAAGCNTINQMVNIESHEPDIVIPDQSLFGDIVIFDQTPNAFDWIFDMGDGTTYQGLNFVSHFYNIPGQYMIHITVFTAQCTLELYHLIIVGETEIVEPTKTNFIVIQANDVLFINNINEPSLVSIYDPTGRALIQDIPAEGSMQWQGIDKWSGGIYFVQIKNEREKWVSKIFKK